MALFQKQPAHYDSQQLFSMGLNKTSIVVGLGNIGQKYDKTRHNIGFKVVDALVSSRDELPDWHEKKDLKSHISIGQFGDTRVIVIKPTTLMNLSGEAVSATADFFKVPPGQILVVHDELDINFGQIRTNFGGSSAGHNGVQSIIDKIGDNFSRVRVGIGPKTPPEIDSADFVLSKFTKAEADQQKLLNNEVVALIIEYIFNGSKINQETRSFLV